MLVALQDAEFYVMWVLPQWKKNTGGNGLGIRIFLDSQVSVMHSQV